MEITDGHTNGKIRVSDGRTFERWKCIQCKWILYFTVNTAGVLLNLTLQFMPLRRILVRSCGTAHELESLIRNSHVGFAGSRCHFSIVKIKFVFAMFMPFGENTKDQSDARPCALLQ